MSDIPMVLQNHPILTMKIDFFEKAKGLTESYWSPLAIPEMTEEIVVRSFDWFEQVRAVGGKIGDEAYLIFEVMQKVRLLRFSMQILIPPDSKE